MIKLVVQLTWSMDREKADAHYMSRSLQEILNLQQGSVVELWWRKGTFWTAFLWAVLDIPYFWNRVTSFTSVGLLHQAWVVARITSLDCQTGETLGSFPPVELTAQWWNRMHFVSVYSTRLSDSKIRIAHRIVSNACCYASRSEKNKKLTHFPVTCIYSGASAGFTDILLIVFSHFFNRNQMCCWWDCY